MYSRFGGQRRTESEPDKDHEERQNTDGDSDKTKLERSEHLTFIKERK